MYKYSVDNRRWILSILISPFSWASVTLCEQLGSAPLGRQASAQEKTLFSSSVSSIEGLLLQHNTTAQRSPTEGNRAKEERQDLLLALSLPAAGALSLQKEHHPSHP